MSRLFVSSTKTIMEDWSSVQTVTTMGREDGIVYKPTQNYYSNAHGGKGISNLNDCRYTTIYFSKCR